MLHASCSVRCYTRELYTVTLSSCRNWFCQLFTSYTEPSYFCCKSSYQFLGILGSWTFFAIFHGLGSHQRKTSSLILAEYWVSSWKYLNVSLRRMLRTLQFLANAYLSVYCDITESLLLQPLLLLLQLPIVQLHMCSRKTVTLHFWALLFIVHLRLTGKLVVDFLLVTI